MREAASLKKRLASFDALQSEYDDLIMLIDLGLEESDASMLDDTQRAFCDFVKNYEDFKTQTLLDGEFDKNNALMTLHSGAGGTEACDWALMLLRMYTKWAEKNGFKMEITDILEGDEAGIKSVSLFINGENAYGYLKAEKGVHRLVRMSPFDASGRRHTSFASCDILPEIDDSLDLDIDEDDLKIDTYRSSGAGGQHVNKTESAIRITHVPTGIVAACQNERSQHKNRATAMRMLKSKLYAKKHAEQMDKIQNIRGEIKDIAWGSQIRSYTFAPFTLVKDHRTQVETGNVNAVMDGDINAFINAYLTFIHSA